jgi:hypothetical protein
MKRLVRVALGTFAALTTGIPLVQAQAQDKPGTVAEIILTRVKPGMTKAYEEGRKRHSAWHKTQADKWGWLTWEVASGDELGAYVTGSFGHHWKDFDAWEAKLGQADSADAEVNLNPSTASARLSYYQVLADVSRPGPDPTKPAKMAEVVHFLLKPSKEAMFRDAIARIHEAIGKTNWPVSYIWYVLVNGGEGPHIALVLPHDSWAGMEEPEPSFPAMLTKAFGSFEAARLMGAIDDSIRAQSSEMLVYRPDLSYVPAP